MSFSDSSDDGSSWDSSDLESALVRPKGSPDIRNGIIFEDVEQFWEKHSPKINKPKSDLNITETLKKISNIEKNQQSQPIANTTQSNQISPIFQRMVVKKPSLLILYKTG